MISKKFNFLILSLATVLLSIVLLSGFNDRAIADTPKHYTELKFPPLPEIKLPQYKRYELDNGMVIYLIEDRSLPIITGSALLRTGSRLEPIEKTGLANLTGSLIRTGGTIDRSSEELNQILEQNAAIIETSIGNTVGQASFSTLTEDFETVLNLFAEVLKNPTFNPDKIDLAKNQRYGAIARRDDNPNDIVSREFNKLIYGEKSPYGRTIENETIENINREDIVQFYSKYIRPENIILGIVGDFKISEIQSQIETVFGSWKVNTPQPEFNIPPANQEYTNKVFLIDREDLTQSNVLLGHIGSTLDNPDYPTLSLINGILNGFGGRLFNEIRSRQGLAYSVYGVWSPNYDYPGKFMAGGQTQTETTVPFIKSILTEIDRLRTNPITEKELANAKESILNSFVFNFQKPSQTLSRLMRYEYFNYPEDFIFQYQESVKATTVEDIQRVAKKYLQPDKIVTLVVGNSSAMNPPLSSLSLEVKSIYNAKR